MKDFFNVSFWLSIGMTTYALSMSFLTFSALCPSSLHILCSWNSLYWTCYFLKLTSLKHNVNPNIFVLPIPTITKKRSVLKQVEFYSLQMFASNKIFLKSCLKRQTEEELKRRTCYPFRSFYKAIKQRWKNNERNKMNCSTYIQK